MTLLDASKERKRELFIKLYETTPEIPQNLIDAINSLKRLCFYHEGVALFKNEDAIYRLCALFVEDRSEEVKENLRIILVHKDYLVKDSDLKKELTCIRDIAMAANLIGKYVNP